MLNIDLYVKMRKYWEQVFCGTVALSALKGPYK